MKPEYTNKVLLLHGVYIQIIVHLSDLNLIHMKKIIAILLVFTLISTVAPSKNVVLHPRIPDSVYVCISTASKRYHAYICKGLARCTHEVKKVSKAQAIRWGYTPCKICYGN